MFDVPDRTLVNRKIPKNKFYEKLDANTKLKELFAEQIETIVWKHKLAQSTMNLDPVDEVQEIQIFELFLRQRGISREILESIDKSIPYPILHVLRYQNEVKLVIAYKQPNQNNENRAVVHSYFESDWQPQDSFRFPITGCLTLGAVYESIIRRLLPVPAKPEEKLAEVVTRQCEIERLRREYARLEAKLRSEKQFNKKVEINIELQKLRQKLQQLAE
ncbi:DUF4391 domain-containing protein [Sporolituus thermophilus]|uniref:Methyl-accepting chemotaxis protein n=1 Tax=Sporolituus thermophilus DSM 23256 TaxID=1123285 RepID=A0A1G7JS62_9FIRM|nr:DUF4391 domain-containing protein [Sporolituus thermophilus]SDF27725.1 protein of unknown function [Sporolituus thermophilus DSM 23256]